MRDPMYLIGSTLLIVSTLLAVACVAAQALLARWWESGAGRHVMAFQGVLATLLTLWTLRVWIPDSALVLGLRFAAFAGLPVVLGWRLAIIIRTWRSKRREHAKGER